MQPDAGQFQCSRHNGCRMDENALPPPFPRHGKIFGDFSTPWKISVHRWKNFPRHGKNPSTGGKIFHRWTNLPAPFLPHPPAGALSFARISTRRIFPLIVFGSSFANSTTRGYLYGAVAAFTCACSSCASASLPS